jgi:hypothetical protein
MVKMEHAQRESLPKLPPYLIALIIVLGYEVLASTLMTIFFLLIAPNGIAWSDISGAPRALSLLALPYFISALAAGDVIRRLVLPDQMRLSLTLLVCGTVGLFLLNNRINLVQGYVLITLAWALIIAAAIVCVARPQYVAIRAKHYWHLLRTWT